MDRHIEQELKLVATLLNSIPCIFHQYNSEMKLQRWNLELESRTGYTPQELRSMHALDFIVDEDKERARESIRVAYEMGKDTFDVKIKVKDGRSIPYLLTGVRFDKNKQVTFLWIGLDISKYKKAESEFRQQTSMFRALIESTSDGIIVLNNNGERFIQNKRMSELWNIPIEIAENNDPEKQLEFLISKTISPELNKKLVRRLNESNSYIHDIVELKNNIILERYSSPIIGPRGEKYGRIWTFKDITEHHHSKHRIHHLATHDSLTGLANRNLIHDHITQSISKACINGVSGAVFFCDLDRFKVLNDGYGHAFGDEVLKTVAQILISQVREKDIVARLGGDEFLIVIQNIYHINHIIAIAQKLIKTVSEPLIVQGHKTQLSASIGISIFPLNGEDADTIISNADIAMYASKKNGGNSFNLYTPEMGQVIKHRLRLENALHSAISEQQFELFYQPKVSLMTGRITGCEVLLRWYHPQLGYISPNDFIPIAEESELIVKIGDWVLRTASQQACLWRDLGLTPISIAVNLSARQFLRRDITMWVLNILEETGLSPEQLELELTESMIAQDAEVVNDTISALKDLGVKLSIDDFGTGYSNLSYLCRFRVDTLKIDKSFVIDMFDKSENIAIILAVISLGHNLGFKIIAEGCETEAHYQFLRENGCDEVQGFYFSEPVPATMFEIMLEENSRNHTETPK